MASFAENVHLGPPNGAYIGAAATQCSVTGVRRHLRALCTGRTMHLQMGLTSSSAIVDSCCWGALVTILWHIQHINFSSAEQHFLFFVVSLQKGSPGPEISGLFMDIPS